MHPYRGVEVYRENATTSLGGRLFTLTSGGGIYYHPPRWVQEYI